MTSGKFKSVLVSSIFVDRTDRQRKTVKEQDIAELAESIKRIGLINPPVITSDHKLIAGETRLEACRLLGWTAIPIQFVDDLSPMELKRIELEENVKRKALTWQEECFALRELYSLEKAENSSLTIQDLADVCGFSRRWVTDRLEVANEIQSGNEEVGKAGKLSVAVNMVGRAKSRRQASALTKLETTVDQTVPTIVKKKAESPFIFADFHLWQEKYDGPKFNLIHCDFPYGINVADAPRQNSAIKDYYKDSPDVYWGLLERLNLSMQNCVSDSAHLIFWFSMEYYSQTLSVLSEMGWRIYPFPLVWHKSDNAGVAPDPQRLPRRTYETAFFGIRGDRKLTERGTRGMSFAFPGFRKEDSHVSEKPAPVLKHFMEMICDEYSSVLDPTCGGGNALKVAKILGAGQMLGIEVDGGYYELALQNWKA